MALKKLFAKHDIYSIVESQKQRVKQAFDRLSNAVTLDETVTQKLREDYSLKFPVLKIEDQYTAHQKVKVDARNQAGRTILDRSRPIMGGCNRNHRPHPFQRRPRNLQRGPECH